MAGLINDTGLLTGLAAGLKGGLEGYQQARKMQLERDALTQDRELKKRAYQAELMSKGLIETEGGGLEYDQESPAYLKMQAERDYDSMRAENMRAQTEFIRGGKATDLDLAKAGLMRNEFGQIVVNPDSAVVAKQKADDERGLIGLGYTRDEDGKLVVNPESLAAKKAEAEIAAKKAAAEAAARRGRGAGAGPAKLPKDIQEQISVLSKKAAGAAIGVEQMKPLVSVLRDPNIDSGQKLQQARNSAKLLNDVFGSDAVGAEEVKRLMAHLDPWPNLVKMRPGPDLEGFIRNVELKIKQTQDSRKGFEDQIKQLKEAGSGGGSQGLIQEAATASFPRKLFKDGKSVQVSNEKELKEAQAEGWR